MHNAVLMCSYVRICDEGDEALQPEWEVDPKDLQIMEKVSTPFAAALMASYLTIMQPVTASLELSKDNTCVREVSHCRPTVRHSTLADAKQSVSASEHCVTLGVLQAGWGG